LFLSLSLSFCIFKTQSFKQQYLYSDEFVKEAIKNAEICFLQNATGKIDAICVMGIFLQTKCIIKKWGTICALSIDWHKLNCKLYPAFVCMQHNPKQVLRVAFFNGLHDQLLYTKDGQDKIYGGTTKIYTFFNQSLSRSSSNKLYVAYHWGKKLNVTYNLLQQCIAYKCDNKQETDIYDVLLTNFTTELNNLHKELFGMINQDRDQLKKQCTKYLCTLTTLKQMINHIAIGFVKEILNNEFDQCMHQHRCTEWAADHTHHLFNLFTRVESLVYFF